MKENDLKKRTREFAVQIVRLVKDFPVNRTTDTLGRQLLRCGTSVGANYRSACRAKSRADFIAKMAIVEEEADEVSYWLELLVEIGLIKEATASFYIKEANEIVAIAVSSIKTARNSALRNSNSKI
jgi:four helix bundle protein